MLPSPSSARSTRAVALQRFHSVIASSRQTPVHAPTPRRVPVRRARVVVTFGPMRNSTLFTGYIATEPESIYAGAGLAGPAYRIAFSAISDEWLLDKLSLVLTNNGYAAAGGTLLATARRAHSGSGNCFTTSVCRDRQTSRRRSSTPDPTKPWSTNAGLQSPEAPTWRIARWAARSLSQPDWRHHALHARLRFDGSGEHGVQFLRTKDRKREGARQRRHRRRP